METNNVQTIFKYLGLINQEIDIKILNMKQEVSQLGKIYEAIKPNTEIKKKGEDLVVKEVIMRAKGEEMKIEREYQHVTISKFDEYNKLCQEFMSFPHFQRKSFNKSFLDNLMLISEPTPVHIQKRIIMNLKRFVQELETLSNREIGPKVISFIKENASRIFNRYDELLPEGPVNEYFSEPEIIKTRISDNEITKISENPFGQVSEKNIQKLMQIKNSARQSLIQMRIKARCAEIFIPIIQNHKNQEKKHEYIKTLHLCQRILLTPKRRQIVFVQDK